MTEFRTHGADSAIDDELIEAGPFLLSPGNPDSDGASGISEAQPARERQTGPGGARAFIHARKAENGAPHFSEATA